MFGTRKIDLILRLIERKQKQIKVVFIKKKSLELNLTIANAFREGIYSIISLRLALSKDRIHPL